MDEGLIVNSQEGVLYLTIDREAQGNSLTEGLINSLLRHFKDANECKDTKAVCITGRGERFFSTGADLSAILRNKEEGFRAVSQYVTLLRFMTEMEKPLVAKVNGACIGGGMGIMLSCDLALAREDSYFQSPELNWGIFPMVIGALMQRHIGPKRTMDMVLTGRKVYAPEAQAMGLITRSVPSGTLEGEVDKVLTTIRERSCAAMALGKRAFRRVWDMEFNESLDFLSKALWEVFSTEDAREGIRAFVEKRRPSFRGT